MDRADPHWQPRGPAVASSPRWETMRRDERRLVVENEPVNTLLASALQPFDGSERGRRPERGPDDSPKPIYVSEGPWHKQLSPGLAGINRGYSQKRDSMLDLRRLSARRSVPAHIVLWRTGTWSALTR